MLTCSSVGECVNVCETGATHWPVQTFPSSSEVDLIFWTAHQAGGRERKGGEGEYTILGKIVRGGDRPR